LPGLCAGLALGGNRVVAPQMLAGLGIVGFDEAAVAEFGPGHADDDDAFDDKRRAGHRVAVGRCRRIGRFCLPDLLAGLGIERDNPVVHESADNHAVVDGGAAIDDATTHNAQGRRRIFMFDPPDLLSGQGIDGGSAVMGRDVDHAVVDDRKSFPAVQIAQRIRPCGDKFADVLLGNLREWAIAVRRVTHAVDQHILGILLGVFQIIG